MTAPTPAAAAETRAAVNGESVRALTRSPLASQADFRVLLDALARPGTIGRLATGAVAGIGTVSGEPGVSAVPGVPPALLPAAGLCDVEVPLAVLAGPDDDGWAEALYTATGAPPAPPASARMTVALRPVTASEIATLPTGDALAPELGTRLILAVRELSPAEATPVDSDPGGGVTLELSGPGVPGTRRLRVAGADEAVFGALAEANDFPAGIDTFLVDDGGNVAGLPRTTRTRVIKSNGEG